MGMLMIGVAATIFANPLGELVGPDGLLAKGRDTGLEIATSVSDGAMSKQGDGANVDQMVSRLADRFLRSPTQMINFGAVADSISRKCREAWSKGINNERGDKLKDDIKGCDSEKGEAMHQKSMGNPAAILVPLNICGFLALFLAAFACYFVWHVVKAAVQAMLYAALASPAFAIGVIPGGPQTFAWKTVLDCAMAYAAMVIYTAAFGAYNVILDQVFKESTNAIQSIFMTALVLAFGFAVFGPLRRMFDRQRDTMAAKLGGGGAMGGRGGRSLFHKTADLVRIRQEIGDHGWGRSRSPRRDAGRIKPKPIRRAAPAAVVAAVVAVTVVVPRCRSAPPPAPPAQPGTGRLVRAPPTAKRPDASGGRAPNLNRPRRDSSRTRHPRHRHPALPRQPRHMAAASGGAGSGRHALSEAA
jgi:hypothetical protein